MGKQPRQGIQILALAVAVCGCAHYPVNAPLARVDAPTGYRLGAVRAATNSPDMLFMLAFSGGGMRAAALSYGVLEELARTKVTPAGTERRLLDEVDIISAVSGGSFTAAYYALFGDRIFSDFEEKFLKHNIQDALAFRYALPNNWFRLASSRFDMSDLAAEYYDRHLFERHTFGDLLRQEHRPFLMINATDIGLGAPFAFTQDQFDLIGSDLAPFPIGRAVAASSAFPILLSPIVLKNYAVAAAVAEPAWITAAINDPQVSARRLSRALEARSYLEARKRPFVHLLDGGISDNLGLRGLLDAGIERNGFSGALRHFKLDGVRKLVVIVVDAETQTEEDIDKRESAPHLMELMRSVARVPVNRYSFETAELFKETIERAAGELHAERAKAAGAGNAPPPELGLYLVELHFQQVADESERRFFNSVSTRLHLPAKTVDHLRELAASELRHNTVFQKLLRDLGEGVSK